MLASKTAFSKESFNSEAKPRKTKYQLWSGQEFQNLTKKSGLILDDISLVSGVCSKSVVDLGNGPNKPNATIIGEYSASLS